MTSRALRGGFALFAPAFLASFIIANTSAQTPGNTWLAWQGCWRADGAPTDDLLCIVPDGAGVRMITLESNVVRAESRVVADNRPRPINQEGCTGSEVARWSADHRRVFLISQLTCDQKVARQVSGIFAITGPNSWVSAQAVTIEGKTATRSVHYNAVDPINLPQAITSALRTDRGALFAARGIAYTEITEVEINEAVDNIEAAAVQEWLSTTGQPYQLAGNQAYGAPTTMSALDLVGRAANSTQYEAEYAEPTVVERPITYVNTTYVNNVVRSCWDPFFAGYVIGVGYRHVGMSYGRSGCGGRYYGRYSPWGYDLYGWHWVPAPIVIVRPTIIRTSPIIHRPIRRDWDDRRDWDNRRDGDNRGRDDRNDSWGGRATRDGYTRDSGSTRDNNLDRDNRGSSGRSTGTRDNSDDRTRAQPPRSAPPRPSGQPTRIGDGRTTTSGQTITSTRGGSSNGSSSNGSSSSGSSSASSRTARSTATARPSGYSSGSSSSSTGRTAQPRSNN